MRRKLFVILFGVVFVGIGIFLMLKGNDMAKRCTAKATGTVVEVIEEEENNTDDAGYTYMYFPVIEYKAEEQTISQKYSTGDGNQDKYKVGDKVDVLYDPNKPEDYLIKGDEKTSNIMGIVFIVMGAVVAVVGIVKKEV